MVEVSEQQQPTETEVSNQEQSSQEEQLPALDEAQESEPEPSEDIQNEPKQLAELTVIIDFLSRLGQNCTRIREGIDLLDSNKTQLLLQEYASALAYVPKILQLPHDYRRFTPDFDKRVEALYKGLQKARKEESALSSEEERVIVACASIRETLLDAVGGMEYSLAHIRSTTHNLLACIAYEDDDFRSFAQDHLDIINVGLIQGVAFEEESRIRTLKRDILELRSLEDHLARLQPES